MIRQIRNIINEKRVGHAGTLDPLAAGVLVVAVGREYTKKIDQIQAKKKTYLADIILGYKSTTDDDEGEKTAVNISKKPTKKEIEKCLSSFVGTISQRPPQYSAKKIGGVRSYKLLREGKTAKLKPCLVTIYSIVIIKYKYPDLRLQIICSGGTYIRSLSRDIGDILQTGAYLKNLTRTAIGSYKLKDALKII